MEKDLLAESGRIKVLEKTFLTRSFLEKLTQASNLSMYLGELDKTYYQLPKHFTRPGEILDFFEKERSRLQAELEEVLPGPLALFFRIHQDFQNLNLLAKEGFQIKRKQLYSFSGLADPYTLAEALDTGHFDRLPRFLQPAVKALAEARTKGVPTCLFALNRHFHQVRSRLLRRSKNDFLLAYHRQETDWENLACFLLRQGEERKLHVSELLQGGLVAPEKYAVEEVLWKAWTVSYPAVSVPVREETFEREHENALMNFLRPCRRIPYGVEVIFSYYLARDRELAQLQRLTLGKFYNLAPEILKDWLGPGYA